MRREDWISTKETLPEDPEGKRYIIHVVKGNTFLIAAYNNISHSFYREGDPNHYDVNVVDFWSEIKAPGEEQESMYRFHEGMAVKDWHEVIYVIKKVNERSYKAMVYGDPLPNYKDIPLAIQGHYTIIKENNLDLLKPLFHEGMQIRHISDRKVYTIESVINMTKGRYYKVRNEEGKETTIAFGRQRNYVPHFNFEDGDIVRKLKDKGYTDATLYILRKNDQEEIVRPVMTPLMESFYESIRKLDFSLIPADQTTSSFANMQVTYKELEDNYEIVQKHDTPLNIKDYI